MTVGPLNRNMLSAERRRMYNELAEAPVKVLQIGEGNFLRGFFDWMIHESRKQGVFHGSVAVVQPRPGGKPKIEALAAQDGLYTLVIRGLEGGEPMERRDVISVFRRVFDPYAEWDSFLALAEGPELRFVVSNTTEAGLAYRPEALVEGQPVQSFPGKLTLLLYRRFVAFDGDPQRGLICLPCELLEASGDTLRECVLRYCEDWKLPEAFRSWVVEHNRFLNTLVDRIVTGYPDEAQAQKWFEEWGYSDPMLTTAEPYHLWAIEGEPELGRELPLADAGLHVLWVDQLKPYQQRKVRILNGAHTLMALLGLLRGLQEVREAMEDEQLGSLVRSVIEREIIPSLPYEREQLLAYSNDVCERFLNPFIRHRLTDIAMNSLSKFQTRLLPSIRYYLERAGETAVPAGLATALAALLRYYRIRAEKDGSYAGRTLAGESYEVRDDPDMLACIAGIWVQQPQEPSKAEQRDTVSRLLALQELWGEDLNAQYPRLADQVAAIMERWER